MNARALSRAALQDSILVFRDPLLAILPFAPFLASTALRFVLPFLNVILIREFHFDLLARYGGFIRATLIEFPGMFFGMIAGFLILDDRDDGILRYHEASPLGRSGYLVARLGVFSLLAFVSGPLCAAIAGVGIGSLSLDFAVSFLGAFQTPFMALFLGAFAANKVEGLSVAKALGVIDIIPLVLFAQGGLRFSGIPFFQYWGVAMLYRPSGSFLFPWSIPISLMLAIGTIVALAQLALLYRVFLRRTE